MKDEVEDEDEDEKKKEKKEKEEVEKEEEKEGGEEGEGEGGGGGGGGEGGRKRRWRRFVVAEGMRSPRGVAETTRRVEFVRGSWGALPSSFPFERKCP
ncbi:hypothetical protein HZH66_000213 [Vespula vulgaris]|uniref:Uncharacterized protein n=1 Tax=Vespula vulgaris TaxID=7454 RepID=A0A834NJ46_VESVU|nr:hypothetical protein HZH66_000213 [Vespula vulgaris]